MSKIKFIQHIPGFVVGSEPDIIESNNLEELLERVEKYKSDSTVYTCDETGEYLMETVPGGGWLVLGTVIGIDLRDKLPYFLDVGGGWMKELCDETGN